jgi:hypothetical protein
MLNIFKREELPPITWEQKNLVHKTCEPGRLEQRDIERTFARLFSTEDGKKILSYLQVITFHRTLGPGSPDEQLRYMEGQRSMVATILRLIDRGRNA